MKDLQLKKKFTTVETSTPTSLAEPQVRMRRLIIKSSHQNSSPKANPSLDNFYVVELFSLLYFVHSKLLFLFCFLMFDDQEYCDWIFFFILVHLVSFPERLKCIFYFFLCFQLSKE